MLIPSIADSVVKLSVKFPVGATADRSAAMVQTLKRWSRRPVDVARGVEWLVVHREAATFPTDAQLINAISTRQVEREQGRSDGARQEATEAWRRSQKPLTPDEIDQVKKVRQLGRKGIFWCGRNAEFTTRPVRMWRGAVATPGGNLGLDGYQHVTREKIWAAWQLQFEPGQPPPEPTGTVADDALGDLFGEN